MFNKETEYALRGLVYIQMQNMNGKRPGIIEIAKEIEAPQFYTAKILQRMVKHGLLVSQKGKGGGFFFEEGRPPLYLKEIIELTEGNKTLTSCGFGLKYCSCENPCPMHDQFIIVRQAINKMVTTETVQSLAKKYVKK